METAQASGTPPAERDANVEKTSPQSELSFSECSLLRYSSEASLAIRRERAAMSTVRGQMRLQFPSRKGNFSFGKEKRQEVFPSSATADTSSSSPAPSSSLPSIEASLSSRAPSPSVSPSPFSADSDIERQRAERTKDWMARFYEDDIVKLAKAVRDCHSPKTNKRPAPEGVARASKSEPARREKSRRLQGLKPEVQTTGILGIPDGKEEETLLEEAERFIDNDDQPRTPKIKRNINGQVTETEVRCVDDVELPLYLESIGTTVLSLGAVSDDMLLSKDFWSSRQCLYHHPYPVGFRAEKEVFGKNWIMEIKEKNGRPHFVVRAEDGRQYYEGDSPTKPWTEVCIKSSGKFSNGTRISGPQYFGFSDPLLQHILRLLVLETCSEINSCPAKKSHKAQTCLYRPEEL